MSSSTLIRWSGLAALVGYALLAVVDPVVFFVAPDNGATSVAAASNWCATNGSRFRWRLAALFAQMARLLCCPASSGRIGACPGKSGWRAMPPARAAGQVTIHLFGVPDAFACFLGLATT